MSTTTIYVPTPITSTGQADALPRGLMAARIEEGKIAYTEDLDLLDDEEIGANDLYVLVPVEVEVEHLRETGGRRRSKTLYVTEWEVDS